MPYNGNAKEKVPRRQSQKICGILQSLGFDPIKWKEIKSLAFY